jgi:glucoamylase
MHDNARTFADALIASDGNVGTALVANTPLNEITNGFRGTADGLTQLQKTGGLTELYSEATNGNVVQVARLQQPQKFTLALGFGAEPTEALVNARFSILKGFDKTNREYERTWRNYLAGLRRVKWRYQRQFNMAAMVLKGLEDKTYRGAIIASPSIPWGGGANANEATISGYHAVWPRDLYQVATALYLAGDRATANRSLDYLLNIQRPDGSFPQNCWVNGTPIGNGLQLDQVALPIVLAHQLRRFDRTTWIRHIKPAADFVIRHGPSTKQERWEEESGYSPSTIGAEIAGLICASDIARIHRDKKAADKYLRTADDWSDSVVKWTATSNGPAGDGKYFLRITEKGNPDEGSKIEINSGGGTFDQREIVDAGFLELVRLGIKNADDPLILKSLAMIDKLIKVETPVGPGWYRYNHDAYGERPDGVDYDGRSGKGRLWTLLTGERAEFELAHKNVSEAMKLLDTLSNFANEGLMLPEQVWDGSGPSNVKPGKGTGSATPLAWSMAQFMRLAINVQNGRNLDTPLIVRNRYASR